MGVRRMNAKMIIVGIMAGAMMTIAVFAFLAGPRDTDADTELFLGFGSSTPAPTVGGDPASNCNAVCDCDTANGYAKYYSIADDSGPWLCGETCIRPSFYWIFHIFEQNLTKAVTNTPCADAGYTVYNSTQTHGGGGLYCTLDLYSCDQGIWSTKCPHPCQTHNIFGR